jgi:hypothetical protein
MVGIGIGVDVGGGMRVGGGDGINVGSLVAVGGWADMVGRRIGDGIVARGETSGETSGIGAQAETTRIRTRLTCKRLDCTMAPKSPSTCCPAATSLMIASISESGNWPSHDFPFRQILLQLCQALPRMGRRIK